jgi:hypothetical protein
VVVVVLLVQGRLEEMVVAALEVQLLIVLD